MKALAAFLAMFVLAFGLGTGTGYFYGRQSCSLTVAKADSQAKDSVIAGAKKGVTKANQVGAEKERARVALDHQFDQLEKEANHAPADPVDSCLLPDRRLHFWRQANDGPDMDSTVAESDPAAAAAAAAGQRDAARAGEESPAGGPAVPPAGDATLRSAGSPGDHAR